MSLSTTAAVRGLVALSLGLGTTVAGTVLPAQAEGSGGTPMAFGDHPAGHVTVAAIRQVLPASPFGILAVGPSVAAEVQAEAVAAEKARVQAAAKKAADKKAAEERAAAAAREARDSAGGSASRSAARSGSPRAIGRALAADRGWGGRQFACLDRLWTKESGWKATADNPTSSAYGIPQALPGRKMASHGSDWRTNPATQIRWGLDYIADVYGTPCSAWAHSRAHNWY